MPQNNFKITPLVSKVATDSVTVGQFNRFITELNRAMTDIANAIGELKGSDGVVPTLSNDLDLNGNRLLNVKELKFSDRNRVTVSAFDRLVTDTLDIPDPADTPLTADDLRDDLVDNTLPAIRSSFEAIIEKLKQVVRVISV